MGVGNRTAGLPAVEFVQALTGHRLLTVTGATELKSASRDGKLGARQWRFLALLGVPALGITFAVTAVSTYAPVSIGGKSSPVLVGAIVGGEGFFGLFVPVFAGVASDRWAERAQQRVRLMLVASVVGVAGLLVLMIPDGVWLVAVGAAMYFAGHFAYLAPFQALFADLVPNASSGRSRSAESVWRLTGAASALIAGGFLITAWKPAPFLVAAVLLSVTTAMLWRFLGRTRPVKLSGTQRDVSQAWRATFEVLRDRRVRLLAAANVLWNITLSALRAFVVLFFTLGLGRSPSFVSGVVFPLVALGMAASAPISGKLADRWGPVRLLQVAVPVYGGGLLLPGFSQASWVLGCVPVVAAAAATTMVVPFAALMRFMPEKDHGAVSGVFTLSRGAGTLLGPLLAGAAISLLRGPLSSTHGYAAMWFVIGAATLATIPILIRIRDELRGDAATGT